MMLKDLEAAKSTLDSANRKITLVDLRRRWGKFDEVELAAITSTADLVMQVQAKYGLDKRKQGSIKGALKEGKSTQWERGRSLKVQKYGPQPNSGRWLSWSEPDGSNPTKAVNGASEMRTTLVLARFPRVPPVGGCTGGIAQHLLSRSAANERFSFVALSLFGFHGAAILSASSAVARDRKSLTLKV